MKAECVDKQDTTMAQDLADIVKKHALGAAASGLGVAWLPGVGSSAAVIAMALFATTIPVIGETVNSTAGLALNAWSRRSEVSADRAGLLCCGNLDVAEHALVQLEMGLLDGGTANVEEYIERSNQYRKGNVLRRLGEYAQSHPLMTKRLEALQLFLQSALLYRIAGEVAPKEAITDRELERRIEKLVRVL